MNRKCYWQKSAVCELGCIFYRKYEDGKEACKKVGYYLHPDWEEEIADDCDDFRTLEQYEAERAAAEVRAKLERKTRRKTR